MPEGKATVDGLVTVDALDRSMDVEASDLLVVDDAEVVVSAAVTTPARRARANDDHLMVKGVAGVRQNGDGEEEGVIW